MLWYLTKKQKVNAKNTDDCSKGDAEF